MPDWNELFTKDDFSLDNPHPSAVSFAENIQAGSRVLDHGCGAGRHLPLFLDTNAYVTGMDISPNGLDRSIERVKNHAHKDMLTLVLGDMLSLPFSDHSYDAIASINVINHGNWSEMERAFSECHRLLKPGGIFRALVISNEDPRCGKGDNIEPRTWVPTEGIEEGIPHHYFNEDDLRALETLNQWEIEWIELRKQIYTGKNDGTCGSIPDGWRTKQDFVCHWDIAFRV